MSNIYQGWPNVNYLIKVTIAQQRSSLNVTKSILAAVSTQSFLHALMTSGPGLVVSLISSPGNQLWHLYSAGWSQASSSCPSRVGCAVPAVQGWRLAGHGVAASAAVKCRCLGVGGGTGVDAVVACHWPIRCHGTGVVTTRLTLLFPLFLLSSSCRLWWSFSHHRHS